VLDGIGNVGGRKSGRHLFPAIPDQVGAMRKQKLVKHTFRL
jgi:hypothetical protein